MSTTTRSKAQLAMTAEDHEQQGHVPPPILKDNPCTTLEQVLTASHGLTDFIGHQVCDTKESYESAIRGNGSDKKFLCVMLDYFLGPNIAYLREIGRFPQEFADLDPHTRFAIPAK